MNSFFLWYVIAVVALFLSHKMPGWVSKSYQPVGGTDWAARLEKRLAKREHQPLLWVDIVLAAAAFVTMYAATTIQPNPDSGLGAGDIAVGCFVGSGFFLLLMFGVGVNIAVDGGWSRSYPLAVIFFCTIVVLFAKTYTLLGMVDGGKPTNDPRTALYLSLSIITSSDSEVVPSVDSRFVAAAEGIIGYVMLAFLAALMYSTMRRGMEAQIARYNEWRALLLSSKDQKEKS